MHGWLLPVFVGWLATAYSESVAQPPDVEFRRSARFDVRKNKGNFEVSSKVDVSIRLLSDAARSFRIQNIGESFHRRVSGIKASYNEKSVGRQAISTRYPDLEDVFISEFRLHTIEFPEKASVGDVLRYQFQETYEDPVFIPILNIPNLDRVEAYVVTFAHPDDVDVDFDFYFPRDSVRYIIERKSGETALRFGPIPRMRSLSYFPFNEVSVVIVPRLSVGGRPINALTPPDYARWYLNMVEPSRKTSLQSDMLLERITAGTPSTVDKVKALFNFVKDSIRYIAVADSNHSIVPRAPAATVRTFYGDCKDRALLLATWGQQVGVPVHMVLVSTDWEYPIAAQHGSQFNHVICMMEGPDGRLYFDPTSRYTSFGKLPESVIGKPVLVLDETSGYVDTLPDPLNQPTVELHISGSPHDPTRMHARLTLGNEFYAYAKRPLAGRKATDLGNFLTLAVAPLLNKILLTEFSEAEDRDSVLLFSARADLGRFIVQSNDRTYIPGTAFRIFDSDILDREDDPYALYLSQGHRIRLTLDLDSVGLRLKDVSFRAGREGAYTYRSSAACSDSGRIRIVYELACRQKRFTADEKHDFLEFCRTYFKQKTSMITLERTP